MVRSFRPITAALFAALAVAAATAFAAPARAQEPVTVFAAASLKESIEQVATAWKAAGGTDVRFSFAGSSALAKQIQEGAPADIFISADLKWMDHLDQAGRIKTESRFDLLSNRIVLVAPKDSELTTTIVPNFPLATLLGDERLAMANVDAVPAGTYGKAALDTLGVWPQRGEPASPKPRMSAPRLLPCLTRRGAARHRL